MPESLVIRLPENEREPCEAVIVSEGAAGARVERGTLPELTRFAEGRRVCVLVPAAHVLVTDVDLPVRGATKILQAMPFALEEQLAEDITNLHFAIGKRAGDGRIPVAVVARNRIDAWLAKLEEAAIPAQQMISESEALPRHSDAVVALIEHDRVLLRCPRQPPVVGHSQTLESLLDLCGITLPVATEEESEQPLERPERIIVYASAGDREDHAALLERLPARDLAVEQRELSGEAVRLLAREALANGAALNLLQGTYAPATAIETWWRPWRQAAMLLVAVIAASLGVQAVRAMQLGAAEARLDARIATVLREACPGERAIVDARQQMQRCVDRVLGANASAEEVFLSMMGTLSEVLADTPDTQIQQISFRNRILDLKFTAPNVETLDRIKRLIAERGSLEMEIESTRPTSEGVESQAEIRKPVA